MTSLGLISSRELPLYITSDMLKSSLFLCHFVSNIGGKPELFLIIQLISKFDRYGVACPPEGVIVKTGVPNCERRDWISIWYYIMYFSNKGNLKRRKETEQFLLTQSMNHLRVVWTVASVTDCIKCYCVVFVRLESIGESNFIRPGGKESFSVFIKNNDRIGINPCVVNWHSPFQM